MGFVPPVSKAERREFNAQEVVVRVARPDEVRKWNALMNENHYLGFRQFAGRGLRYVAEYEGKWIALAGWQSGAFKCRPRDRWIGWKQKRQFRNLHLIANNTRFLILGEAGEFPNLASYFMGAMTKRLSSDWEERYGHGLLVAESFVDPRHFTGSMYRASNWIMVGRSKGYARSNGSYTEPHGRPKELYVYELRRGACRMLCGAGSLGERWKPKSVETGKTREEMRSLHEELCCVEDFRRAQGRKHSVASVLAVYILAFLCGMRGPVAAAEYARSLSQKDLECLGAWYNRKTGKYEPVSKSTMHRVISELDPWEFQSVVARYSSVRVRFGEAVAADGKRVRAANRNGEGHYEVVTLVEHRSGMPLASLDLRDEGGESAAVGAVLEQADVRGRVITLDALHTTRKTARSIVEIHGADYLFTVKGNCPRTYEVLNSVNWEQDATGRFTEKAGKDHGRIEQRSIEVMDAYFRMINYPHVKQVFRVRRWRKDTKTKKETVEYAFGITSADRQKSSPQQLLAWNRGHWSVENKNHYIRDKTFGEDRCMSRVRNAPANNAICANIALAVIFHKGFDNAAKALRRFRLNKEEAFEAVFSPG